MFATADELRAYLGVWEVVEEEAAPIEFCLSAAHAFMDSYTNRTLGETHHYHQLTPSSPNSVLTPEFPIRTIHGLTVYNSSCITASPMVVDLASIRVRRNGLLVFYSTYLTPNSIVHIDYTAGYNSSDPEFRTLKWLVLEIAGQMYRNRSLGNIQDYQSGASRFTKFDSKEFGLGIFGPDVATTLGMFAVRGPRSIDR
ncbi:MAG: hypothetical protein QXT73_00835 [Candidatus Methanomethylicaceae archaeon]